MSDRRHRHHAPSRADHHRPPDRTIDVDVVVVGARVAGAATALLVARAGHAVALVDRTTFPSDTLSTHAIARSGVVQLSRWGLLEPLHHLGTPQVREVAFHSADGVATRRLKDRCGVDHLIAPRRHVLDPLLVAEAGRAGAQVHTGTAVRDVEHDKTGRATGVRAETGNGEHLRFRARHVVGADGLNSTVAARLSAPIVETRPSTAATHYVHVADLDTTGFEYHVADGSLSGVFPTNGDQACIWVCCDADRTAALRAPQADRSAEFDKLLRNCAPSLAERVTSACATGPVRGAIRLPNRVLRAAGPGWWLVGDAGYHRDPLTGHGITDAFRDAEYLADALHGHLTGQVAEARARLRFASRRDAALRPVFELTCAMADFPPVPRFVELQKRLSTLIEQEAHEFAAQGERPWTAPSDVVRPESVLVSPA